MATENKVRTISEIDFQDMRDLVERLRSLFTDKIEEYHKVKGGQYARHAFIYYRELTYQIEILLKKNIKSDVNT